MLCGQFPAFKQFPDFLDTRTLLMTIGLAAFCRAFRASFFPLYTRGSRCSFFFPLGTYIGKVTIFLIRFPLRSSRFFPWPDLPLFLYCNLGFDRRLNCYSVEIRSSMKVETAAPRTPGFPRTFLSAHVEA